jgi:hypothetical protein
MGALAVKRQKWRRPVSGPQRAPIGDTWRCGKCRRALAMTHKWRWVPGGLYRQKWCIECCGGGQ